MLFPAANSVMVLEPLLNVGSFPDVKHSPVAFAFTPDNVDSGLRLQKIRRGIRSLKLVTPVFKGHNLVLSWQCESRHLCIGTMSAL